MTSKIGNAKGLAVYEMRVHGEVEDEALVALAEDAMRGAAMTVTEDVTIGDLSAEFHSPLAGGTLRAEALVTRKRGETMRVAADVLVGGRRVASFEADALAAA